jgi:molybdate transport system ATP-binding protein
MKLDAQIRATLGSLDLDVELAADAGETVAILGPNGAGKTTLLRTLAGLLPLDHGHIELDGSTLDDGAGTFVPPERRPIGVVFQDYLLFPNLSALENAAFGLRARGMPRTEARAVAARWLGTVGLADRHEAKPRELSGGQAQRVALVRALATRPRLLLLDEPLAALDQSARVELRHELRKNLASFDGIRLLVSHDPLDAATLAERVVVLEHGRVIQAGTFPDLAANPRSRYVAELAGVNLLTGAGRGDHLDLDSGDQLVAPGAGSGPVLAVVHPHSVSLSRDRPTGSARNAWPGTVDSIQLLGERVRVRVAGVVPLIAEITPAALHDLELHEGGTVWASVKATDITLSPA